MQLSRESSKSCSQTWQKSLVFSPPPLSFHSLYVCFLSAAVLQKLIRPARHTRQLVLIKLQHCVYGLRSAMVRTVARGSWILSQPVPASLDLVRQDLVWGIKTTAMEARIFTVTTRYCSSTGSSLLISPSLSTQSLSLSPDSWAPLHPILPPVMEHSSIHHQALCSEWGWEETGRGARKVSSESPAHASKIRCHLGQGGLVRIQSPYQKGTCSIYCRMSFGQCHWKSLRYCGCRSLPCAINHEMTRARE